MTNDSSGRVAILYPGDWEARQNATAENNRFADLFHAFAAAGISAETAVYHDDFAEAVRAQLLQAAMVLVWVNPIHDGRDRTVLDALLRDVAAAGVFVSTHPDIIMKLGTKEVLVDTRHMGWGSDTHLYRTLDEMRAALPPRLGNGQARVLKQYRGHSGEGVWKVQLAPANPRGQTLVAVRHARRGSPEEIIPLEEFFGRCAPYFLGAGRMIDQAYQDRLPEGMIRCYLVHDRVEGFGHQAINALYPAPPGRPATEAPEPDPRLYFPPTRPDFQRHKRQLEQEWLPELQALLGIDTASLPVLWDCDFLLGPRNAAGEDTYVLGEINVSSVAPYPESVVPAIIGAVAARLSALR